MSTDAEPQPVPQPVAAYVTTTAFERKLTGIITRAESEDAAQSMFLMLLIREIHAIKLILVWVLIIVPIVMVVFGALLLAAAHQTPAPTTSTFGY